MPMRPLRLPGDLVPLAEMLVKTFQYPENPEWGIRADEEEDLAREIRNLRRIWPIVRAFQFVSPALRDLLRGFVWEEDGRIVGVVLCQHQGTTRSWGIGIVGVLPEHRGRGIARALLMRALDDLRSWDADKAILSVIDRNVPAYGLYKSVGFEHYSGAVELECGPSGRVDVPALPTGYVAEPVRPSRLWRLRYELDQRITPPEVRRYQPVVIGRYRPPVAVRAILPAVRLLQRREERAIAVRQSEDGRLVALGRYDVPKRPGGVNSIRVSLDPEHARLADHLVAYHVDRALTRGPGRRVGFPIPSWMTGLVESAERAGFKRRVTYHNLGLSF